MEAIKCECGLAMFKFAHRAEPYCDDCDGSCAEECIGPGRRAWNESRARCKCGNPPSERCPDCRMPLCPGCTDDFDRCGDCAEAVEACRLGAMENEERCT
ncbi:MAG: hypothetical protein ACRELB_15470 [Polyangiaceae bacterium]